MKFLTAAGEKAIEEASAAIEAVSSAEIVIAVRSRARHSTIQHAIVGAVAAIATLAFVLYGNFAFAKWLILVLPIVAGVLGAVLVATVPALYRFLEPPWLRYEHVREAAFALFVESRVHATRDRTGVLIYIAVRERMVEIVGDIAVADKFGIEELASMAGTLEAYLPRGSEAFGKALAELAPELAKRLPRGEGDRNELPDAVRVV